MQTMSYPPPTHTQYLGFNHPEPAFSSIDFPDDPSFDTMLSSTNSVNSMQQNAPAPADFMKPARSFKLGNPSQKCRFQARVVDNCYKSRFYALALEYYLLEEAAHPTPDGVRCMISGCPRAFPDARRMLWHLRECNYFSRGKYNCPECQVTERFRTTSQRNCSWLRDRFCDKTMQFLRASAEVIKRITGPKSNLCSKCRHTVREDFANTYRRHSSLTTGVDDPPPFVSCEQFPSYSEHGKLPIRQSSSFSGFSSQEPHELFDASNMPHVHELPWEVHELPWEQSREPRSELVGDDAFIPDWNFAARSDSRRSRVPMASHRTSPTGISCVSERSMGGYSTDVSPTSSSKSPNTFGDAKASQHQAEFNSFFPTNTHDLAVGIAQSSASVERHVYRQSMDAACNPDLSTGIFPQSSFEGNNHNIRTDGAHNSQSTPSPSMEIPLECGAQFQSMAWDPNNAEFTLENAILDFRTTAVTPATPTKQSSMSSFANPSTNRFTRAVAAATKLGNFCRQEKKVSFSSEASSGSTGEAHSSPGSGGKQAPTTDLKCPECGFVPSGKAEKAATYFHKHQLNHLGKRYTCPHCHKTFSRKDNAAAHVKKAHEGGSGQGTPSTGSAGKKRQGSDDSDLLSAQRKKSRSHSNESVAFQSSGQWGRAL